MINDQVEFQNKTSWELKGGGYNSNEFWIPKRHQKELQNTTSLGLQKVGRDNPRFLDLTKNKKRSENETMDGELEGKAWRDQGANVLYSIHCTVQYHDGAFKGNRVDFSAVDNDIGRSLMIDVFNTEIHGNNCTRAKVTPDQKYCSNRQDKDQFTTREDKADFSPVVIRTGRTTCGHGSLIVNELKARVNEIDCMGPHLAPTCTEDEADFLTVVSRANIDGSKIEVRLVDIDIMENMIVDELRTEIYEIDYMGPHLAPTCTERYYSNVDREVDTDGDRTVSVLQWLERKDTEQIPVSGQSNHLPLGVFCRPGNRGRECSQVWPELVRWTSSMTSTPPSTTECTLRTTIRPRGRCQCSAPASSSEC